MSRFRFDRFAWGIVGATLLVILWGAYVRASLSGDGCGAHWPSCGGGVLPAQVQTKTIVEVSHRLTSLFLIVSTLGLMIWSRYEYVPGHIVRKGAGWSFGLVMSEALVGAGLVLFKLVAHNPSMQRAVAMCAHLIVTLFLVAAMTLTAWWASGGARLQWSRLREESTPLRNLFALSFAAVLVVAVTGSLSALGDTLYPSKTLMEGIRQDFAPSASYLLQHRPLHPLSALIATVLVLAACASSTRFSADARTKQFALTTAALMVSQVVLGLINLLYLAPIPLQLLHLLMANLLWISLVVTAAHALGEQTESWTERVEKTEIEEVSRTWQEPIPLVR